MNKLVIEKTSLEGSYTIEPNNYKDDRGIFSRVFCKEELNEIFNGNIMQINHSITNKKGTTRGLHFQYPPNTEVKIIKCIKGSIFDVIVDIRKNSKTFLKVHCEILTSTNMKGLYVPEGFAHGFQTLEDNTELLYLHSEVYSPNNEGAINITDPLLDIKWPLQVCNVSRRDKEHKFINQLFEGVNL